MDMAVLGATLGVLLFICLVTIGVLACRIRRGDADWRKIYETNMFRSSVSYNLCVVHNLVFSSGYYCLYVIHLSQQLALIAVRSDCDVPLFGRMWGQRLCVTCSKILPADQA